MLLGYQHFFVLIISGLLGISLESGVAVTIDPKNNTFLEPVVCEALLEHYCYGEQLPYLHTLSPSRVSDEKPYFRLRSAAFFEEAERFRYLPACWTALQPLLCALRYPKCQDGRKQALSRNICDRAMLACQSVEENIPTLLSNCSDPHLFGQEDSDMDFSNTMLGLAFNRTDGLCPRPLARTSDPARFYAGISHCGMQCEDPFLASRDVSGFHIVVLTLAIVCVIFNAFGLASIILKLRLVHSASFNPDRCVLFMNLSFLLSSCGYLLQFFPHTRDMVTCTEDGLRQLVVRLDDCSVRVGLCLLSFLLTYVFTLSGLVWFGHLMFACFLDFQKIINSHRKSKVTTFPLARSSFVFFHGTAWVLPLVPAIAMILLNSVQGNSLLGVCWITPRYKTAFVITPFALVLLTALVFTGLYWWNLRKSQLSQFGTLKTQRNVLRRLRLVGGICVGVLVLHLLQLAGIWCVVYNESTWSAALRDFTKCQMESMTSENPVDCSDRLMAVRKSYLGAFYAMIVPYFTTGIAIAMWTWNSANFHRWKSLIRGGKFSDMQIYRTNSRRIVEEYELKNTAGETGEDASRLLRLDPVARKVSLRRHKSEGVTKDMDRQRFERNSILPGQKISSVAEFDQYNSKLENWQERARECRLGRRKSDSGMSGAGFRISVSHPSHHNLSEARVASHKAINRTNSHGSALHHHQPSCLKEQVPQSKRVNSISSSEFIKF